jgi:glycosyltransferase involved in cell wall biosynthesis
MKVIVATSIEPFVSGGASLLADWLSRALRSRGHSVEEFHIPFVYRYPEVFEQMVGLRLLDLHDCADRLIAIRPPSYLLRHLKKVLWFIHHHRAAYDLWGTEYGDLTDSPEDRRYRNAIFQADQLAFGEATKIFTNSQVVSDRVKLFNGFDTEILSPPLFDPQRYFCRQYGDSLLYVSRLVHHKRQWLAIESLKYTKSPVGLIIAGTAADSSYVDELQQLAVKCGVDNRVTFFSEWISEERKIALFADCLAALYFPYDEDSYGYASLEAHHAQKCVITTSDAGGTKELITDGENGFITSPEPAAIAEAMDKLYWNRDLARSMGRAAGTMPAVLGISWDRVVEKLLQ